MVIAKKDSGEKPEPQKPGQQKPGQNQKPDQQQKNALPLPPRVVRWLPLLRP